MYQIRVVNDRMVVDGLTTYLGIPKYLLDSGQAVTLPKDYDGWFAFMRLCYSIGDLSIVSAMFKALKDKYPKIKIALPSVEYANRLMGEEIRRWSYDGKSSGADNMNITWANNPYIDKIFNVGDFTSVFTDHDRCYKELVMIDGKLKSSEDPLVEQLLRRFGLTEEEMSKMDLSPQFYFTPEEIERNDKVIEKYFGNDDYGCLLFAARTDKYKERWEHEPMLYDAGEKFKNKPVFYFTEHELKNTEWDNFFPNRVNFADLNISLRDQIYIKRKALFNISYQTGITDASYGDGSEIHLLAMENSMRENTIRGVNYYFKNGTKKIF